MQLPVEDKFYATKNEMKENIVVLLGGRVTVGGVEVFLSSSPCPSLPMDSGWQGPFIFVSPGQGLAQSRCPLNNFPIE